MPAATRKGRRSSGSAQRAGSGGAGGVGLLPCIPGTPSGISRVTEYLRRREKLGGHVENVAGDAAAPCYSNEALRVIGTRGRPKLRRGRSLTAEMVKELVRHDVRDQPAYWLSMSTDETRFIYLGLCVWHGSGEREPCLREGEARRPSAAADEEKPAPNGAARLIRGPARARGR